MDKIIFSEVAPYSDPDALRNNLFELLTTYDERFSKRGIYAQTMGELLTGPFISFVTSQFRDLVEMLMADVSVWKYYMLHQNTTDEAAGAMRVVHMAQSAEPRVRELMERHASDEERHSRLFGSLLLELGGDLEEAPEAEVQHKWQAIEEYQEDLIVFIARVHSIEVRSWACLTLYIDLLRMRDMSEWPPKTLSVLEAILQDERRHVAYTGMLLHDWAEQGRSDEVRSALVEAIHQTNAETWRDMSRMMEYIGSICA
ncbi:MAG: hypothetical protein C7B47_14775 [Sulfobacillus thermosulfidooxidans]|uniref:Rubrerythrin diiron-binding domain-containing protein n=1 Tax=Sulfobacillus thermosulfidooxidans TaxID=28034 RepID=A0A2T2WQD7_SULTH|nr:MAG: hypothetical protein C7B47_14775 [Sulfobacillus thermosulfidooxidans]